MDVPVATVKSVIEKVDILINMVESQNPEMSHSEFDAFRLLPHLMDELQRCVDANPPWKR